MFRGHYVTYVHRLYSTAFNQDLSNWNVSNVETMYEMFHGSNINQDLSNWNVSNVTSWKGIFKKILVRGKPWIKMDEDNKPTKFLDDANSEKAGEKEKFYGNYAKPPVDTNKPITRARLVEMIDNKQDVTKVNTSEITDMSRLFHNNTSFNQNISEWDTSKVTNMKEMFRNAHDFNQPIGKWDVSNVTDMSGMFRGYFYRGRYTKKILNKFNQDLSNWDVSKVTNMRVMFAMSNFVQNISNWDVSNVTNWGYIFSQYLSGPYKNHGKMKKEFMPAKLFNFKGKL
jgi:surface protein